MSGLNQKWDIEKIAHFFFLLVNATDTSGKNILEKRFKKDPDALKKLLFLIDGIGSLGYEQGVKYAFSVSIFDTIKGPIKDLIEIRKIRSTWRVLTYNAKAQKKLVMLDAFESHKHTSTLKSAQRVKPKAKIVKDILRKSE